MIGQVALYAALVSALLSAVFFVRRRKYDRLEQGHGMGKWAFIAHVVSTALASLYLLHALLTHRFQYHYVYANTDRALAWPYRLSAFWAGAQGSLLFWALMGAAAGLCLLVWMRRRQNSLVMFVLSVNQAFLLSMVLLDSPFRIIVNTPLDGRGINSLLLNPWMIVHPPIILAGYALLVVPMAFSLAALYNEDYHDGLLAALPWAQVGWLMLGAGILIGGVWAYQVLGWGGYWGWDPVENSSLVPWLTASALIHGLLVQRRRGGMLKANHFLAITTYVMVILATFITRSGVMAEYSVHAFAETPLTRALAFFLLSFAAMGFGMFVWRYRTMGDEQQEEQVSTLTRRSSFGLTMIVLGLSASLILLGTLTPVVTGWFGMPASVDSNFYLRTNAPLALLLLLLLGLGVVLGERPLTWSTIPDSLTIPIGVLALTMSVAYFLGLRKPFDLLFIGVGAFALSSNLALVLKTMVRRGIKYSGGYLAHLGIAMILVGFLVSTNYVRSDTIYLASERPAEALGYSFTWRAAPDDAVLRQEVEVARGSFRAIARPLISVSGGEQNREPGIARHLWKDIYLSPAEVMTEFDGQILVGEGRYFTYDEFSLQFVEFSQTQAHGDGDKSTVQAVLLVRYLGDVQMVRPELIVNAGRVEYRGAPFPHTDKTIFLQAVDVRQRLAWFTVGTEPAASQPVLVLEVKEKPMVVMMAIGAVLLSLGTGLACWRRFA
jgi:cytochrome c-type biogenesis protein CcmF